ncbi:MAG: MliC family protein [Meiothermus ruber]|jgi:membrane-bound inhibitor of C-type lysozyme|uniref:C-type lysozyme inhibitor domain-containing protein n=1 Tax=Meiothermus ruber TaxID=277 RepID=A0A7C3HSC4_MEIRU|nr:MliC family protein [Meiothermus ruber]
MRGWILLVWFVGLMGLAQTTDVVQRIYRCAGGVQVRAVYQNSFDRVGVVFNNQTYGPLFQVEAASGVKYSDGRATWWVKGSSAAEEALLMSERSGKVLARACKPVR